MSQSIITCSCVFHRLTHAQFFPYTQFQSQFHDPNIIIYHANLVNLVQNTNKLYKNTSHNMRSKTSQTISHNHIKIKGIKIIGQKHENTKNTQFYQPISIRTSVGPSNTTIL